MPTQIEGAMEIEALQTVSDLTEVYATWNRRENLALGSADEHLTDESLSENQRGWLAEFVKAWDLATKWEDLLCDFLRITRVPQRLRQFRVRREDGAEFPLLGFSMVNDDCPEVVDELLERSLDDGPLCAVAIPVHAGSEMVTLKIEIHNGGNNDPWWRCICRPGV